MALAPATGAILEDRHSRHGYSGQGLSFLAKDTIKLTLTPLVYPQSLPESEVAFLHSHHGLSPRVLGKGLTVDSTFLVSPGGRRKEHEG